MKAEYYLYALYLCLLLVALFWVVALLWRRTFGLGERKQRIEEQMREAEQARSRAREESLFALYRNIEELMDSFEEYVSQSRAAIDQDRQTMADELSQARALLEELRAVQPPAVAEPPPAKPEPTLAPEPEPEPSPTHKPGSRHDAVATRLAQGIGEEQIARELDISINEVRLITFGLRQQ